MSRRDPRSRRALVAVVVGVVLVLVSVVLVSQSRRPTADFGAPPRSTASTSTTTVPAPPGASPTTSASAVAAQPVPRVGVPTRLVVPVLGVDAAVVTVVQSAGILAVPADPKQVGWWAGGALPGATDGSTVIVGHVDTADEGPGALYRADDLIAGDQVMVLTQGGDTISYQVSERHTFPKNTGLPPTLFDQTGAPRLVLITCGGPFDAAIGSYEDNIAVIAQPVG